MMPDCPRPGVEEITRHMMIWVAHLGARLAWRAGRWGRPQDLSGLVMLLASPMAGFITGAIIPVDGSYLVA